ncbi:MAG: MFS transporter, partial [Caldimicrobium sp.]
MENFKAILGPLTLKNFQFFLLGHFISFTGSWIQTTALHWLIYKIRNSTADLGLFVFLTSFPTIFLTLLSGFLIDRFDKKRFLQVLLFFALFPPLIMMILVSWGYYNFWTFLILTFLSSGIAAIDMPLRQVFISEIVPSFYLTKALSLQAISFNSARMLGPALAGYLLQHFSTAYCFFLNALSFFLMLV